MASPAGAKPGRKVHLEVVHDGPTASGRSGRVEFDPQAPAEPDWVETFPEMTDPGLTRVDRGALIALADEHGVTYAANIGTDRLRLRVAKVVPSLLSPEETVWRHAQNVQNVRCRLIAAAEWERVVPELDAKGRLALVDHRVLVDYCVCVARIDQGERALSIEGLWVRGERGAQKNPWTTTLSQYRTQLKGYIAELGLAPGSRLPARGADEGETHGDWG